MTETFRNLTEAYKIYKCFNKLNRKGILRTNYTFDEVYRAYRDNKEVVNGL